MTDEQRDQILITIVSKIDSLDDKVNKLDDKVNKLDDKVNKLDDKVNKLDDNVNELEKNVKQLGIEVKRNAEELVRQREKMAQLEYTLTDKINALFDAREISSDKFKDHQKEFESINRILDNHNARILKLENSNS